MAKSFSFPDPSIYVKRQGIMVSFFSHFALVIVINEERTRMVSAIYVTIPPWANILRDTVY